jgi:hypothetical protein
MLTLDSYQSVTVDAPVTVTGAGGLSVVTNDGGAPNGIFSLQMSGRVDFWNLASHLTVNAVPYTLVNNISALAIAIAANPSGHYALIANYDARVDGTYTASPIPTAFTGDFNGLGHVISNLAIRNLSFSYLGLFASIGAGAMSKISV